MRSHNNNRRKALIAQQLPMGKATPTLPIILIMMIIMIIVIRRVCAGFTTKIITWGIMTIIIPTLIITITIQTLGATVFTHHTAFIAQVIQP